MFKSLKDKLKGWIRKNEEPEEEVSKGEKKKEKGEKKEKKEKKKKEIQKKTKSKESKKEKRKKKKEKIRQEEPRIEKSHVKETKTEEPPPAQEEPEKKSLFSRFTKKLDEETFEELFEELELILLQNNVALAAVESIKTSLRQTLVGNSLKQVNLAEELKEVIEGLLQDPPNLIEQIKKQLPIKSPVVIVFAGINGSGKTTTIAKTAHLLQKNNLTVSLAAADTFRAASIEQISEHSKRLNVPLTKKDYGSDPASVGYDAINHAKKEGIDVVLIDTAGRMQNKDSLMREIEKIVRVTKPDFTFFVGESITGNDVTHQAQAFNDSIGITGIILSKTDVDEKGGAAISVTKATGKPIFFIGTGQTYDDLEPFSKEKILKTLGL